MGLDAGIYNAFGARPKSVADYDAEAAQRDNALMTQQQNLLGLQQSRMKMDEYTRGQGEQKSLRDYLGGGANLGTDQGVQGLYRVAPGLASGVLSDYGKRQETQSKISKEQADLLKAHLDVMGTLSKNVLANPTPESAAAAVAQWERYTGREAPEERAALARLKTPEDVVAWAKAHALSANDTATKYITNNIGGSTVTQAINPVTGAVTTASTLANSQSPDNIATNATSRANNAASVGATIRGQNLTDARSREANGAAMSKPFEVTGADGKPVLVQQDKAGNIRPVADYLPKMGAEKPLPEGAQKQLVGSRNLQDAVGNYREKLASWSKGKMLSPDGRAEMGNAYNNMMLQAKEAYNLGVLNGPDYDILQSVVKDPTKLGSVMTSNGAMDGQAKELDRIAAGIEKTVLESHGKQYKPRTPGNPAAGAAPGNRPPLSSFGPK